MAIRAILSEHPNFVAPSAQLLDCIDMCNDCAVICNSCADACLAESNVAALRHCIELNQVCADLCTTTARFLSRLSVNDELLQSQLLLACERACKLCGQECRMHEGMHKHCRTCANACQRCEEICHSYAQQHQQQALAQ